MIRLTKESVQTKRPTTVHELFEDRYEPEVRRAAVMLRSANVAHDVVADAFCALLQRWDQVDNPEAYLSRSVMNGCKRAAKVASREQPGHRTEAHGWPVRDRSVADAFIVRDEILDAVHELPWLQQAVVVLRFYEDMAEREIAACLDVRPGSVGPSLTRAMQKLRKDLPNV